MTRPFFFGRRANDDMMSKSIHFVHNEFQYKKKGNEILFCNLNNCVFLIFCCKFVGISDHLPFLAMLIFMFAYSSFEIVFSSITSLFKTQYL
jgi:hypothetical protein